MSKEPELLAIEAIARIRSAFLDDDSADLTDADSEQDVKLLLAEYDRLAALRASPDHRCDALVTALEFYADSKRYAGSNQRRVADDPYTADDAAYMMDITRDYGVLARAALAAFKAQPSEQGRGAGREDIARIIADSNFAYRGLSGGPGPGAYKIADRILAFGAQK